MSHSCPICDQSCYCDGDDSPAVTADWVADNCVHACEPEPVDELEIEALGDGDPDPRCSATCQGPGPDWADQGPDAAQSIAIPCTNCGRRPEPIGEGSR